MKLNRKWIMVIALVMSLTMATAGTLAYLSDTDADVNVMTLGSVYIVQNEQQRDENGNLEPFEQNKPAYPAVGPIAWADETLKVGDGEYKVFTDELANVIDKIVTVTNTGKSDAYVRTIIALEAPEYDPEGLIHVNVNGDVAHTTWTEVKINGVDYVYSVFTYAEALAPEETSAPSLLQLFLDSKADNKDVAAFGDTWEVLVLSQAIQVNGFEDGGAAAALNEGFGEATVENVQQWFGEWSDWEEGNEIGSPNGNLPEGWVDNNPPKIGTYVTNAQELKDAMLIHDANIILAKDLVIDADTPLQWSKYMFVANGREVTIDLNGKNITVTEDASLKANGLFTTANGGTLNIVGEGTVEVKNGKSGIFHAMNANDQINVYGGTYISNSDNGSDALAIIYTNSGSVDVYGGKFIPADGVTCANAEDKQGNRLCVMFHEGALLSHEIYYAGYDATRIQLEEGCVLQETVINGTTWYKVVKE